MLEIFPVTCISLSVCLYGWSYSNVPLKHPINWKGDLKPLFIPCMWGFVRFGTICTILKVKSTNECEPGTLLKVTLLHGCFAGFLNCRNGTKSCKVSHILWQVSWLNDLRLKGYIQKCNQPRALIFIMTSQFLKLMEWFQNIARTEHYFYM